MSKLSFLCVGILKILSIFLQKNQHSKFKNDKVLFVLYFKLLETQKQTICMFVNSSDAANGAEIEIPFDLIAKLN